MKKERYAELMRVDVHKNPPFGKLTKLELMQGWYFCDCWDGLLIHRKWPEWAICCCILPDDGTIEK